MFVRRDEIIQEVYSVPFKRLDNEVTRVNQDVGSVLLYSHIYLRIADLYSGLVRAWDRRILAAAVTTLALPAVGYMYVREEYRLPWRNISIAVNLLYLPVLYQLSNYLCYQYGKQLLQGDSLDQLYRQKYESTGSTSAGFVNSGISNGGVSGDGNLAAGGGGGNGSMLIPSRIAQRPNEFYSGLWYKSIKPHMQQVLTADHLYRSYSNQALSLFYIRSLVTDADIAHLESVMELDIIRLRKRATKWLTRSAVDPQNREGGSTGADKNSERSPRISSFAHLESEEEQEEGKEEEEQS